MPDVDVGVEDGVVVVVVVLVVLVVVVVVDEVEVDDEGVITETEFEL